MTHNPVALILMIASGLVGGFYGLLWWRGRHWRRMYREIQERSRLQRFQRYQ